MKSEQSTSEMGMKLLLTQFMNLIVGSSQNSEIFWTERVVVGIIQRFGACSIDNNIEHLHRVRKLPDFLKVCFLTAQYHYSVSSSICQCYRRRYVNNLFFFFVGDAEAVLVHDWADAAGQGHEAVHE